MGSGQVPGGGGLNGKRASWLVSHIRSPHGYNRKRLFFLPPLNIKSIKFKGGEKIIKDFYYLIFYYPLLDREIHRSFKFNNSVNREFKIYIYIYYSKKIFFPERKLKWSSFLIDRTTNPPIKKVTGKSYLLFHVRFTIIYCFVFYVGTTLSLVFQ